jgi:predicted dinucleotide-binding enzyme
LGEGRQSGEIIQHHRRQHDGESAFGQENPVLFFCGDDAAAKGTVKPLADELGFEGVDAVPLTRARVLEAFALLWISLAFKAGLGREFAFKLLRR